MGEARSRTQGNQGTFSCPFIYECPEAAAPAQQAPRPGLPSISQPPGLLVAQGYSEGPSLQVCTSKPTSGPSAPNLGQQVP